MDAVSAPEFETAMNQWIDAGDLHFIVDFERLEYISSAGLRSVLMVAKKLQGKKGRILLSSLRKTVKEIFEISGFSTIIPIYTSVEEALKKGAASD